MIEFIIPVSFCILIGLVGFVGAAGRFWFARDARNRIRAFLSLLGACTFITICIGSIFLSLESRYQGWTLAIATTCLLLLNQFIFWRFSKPDVRVPHEEGEE